MPSKIRFSQSDRLVDTSDIDRSRHAYALDIASMFEGEAKPPGKTSVPLDSFSIFAEESQYVIFREHRKGSKVE
jgi:hypothetical protein